MLTPEDESDVEYLFRYHTPSEEAVSRMKDIRSAAYELALQIMHNCPKCADRSAAIRHLREAVMTANASIVLDGHNIDRPRAAGQAGS